MTDWDLYDQVHDAVCLALGEPHRGTCQRVTRAVLDAVAANLEQQARAYHTEIAETYAKIDCACKDQDVCWHRAIECDHPPETHCWHRHDDGYHACGWQRAAERVRGV